MQLLLAIGGHGFVDNMTFRTNKIVDKADRIAGGVRDIFVIIAMTVGLIIASLPPAIVLSTALYRALIDLIGQLPSLVTGISFAILLESTGVVSSHVAIWQYRREGAQDGRFQVAATISFLYMIAGIISIFVFDGDTVIRLAGTFAYVAALMIYISSALASDMRRVEQREQRTISIEEQLEQQEIAWQRQQQDKKDDQDFQLKLKQKEINARVRLAEKGVVVDGDGNIINTVNTVMETPPAPRKTRSKRLTAKQRGFLQYLDQNRMAIKNKTALSKNTGITRPTVDSYLERFEGSHFTVKNGIVQEVDFDGGLDE